MRTRGMAFVACLSLAVAVMSACGGPTPQQKWTLAQAKLIEEGWRPLMHITMDGDLTYWIVCSERAGPTKGEVGMAVTRVSGGESRIEVSDAIKGTRCDGPEAPKTEATPPPQ